MPPPNRIPQNDAQPQTIPEMFYARARESGPQEALRFKWAESWLSLTWSEYEQFVRNLARGLEDWVHPGDFVCILSENRPEWCITDLAILSLGGVTVPLYASNPPKDIAYILEDCGATLLFVSGADQLEKIRALRLEGRAPKLERVAVYDPTGTEAPWLVQFEQLYERNASEPDPVPARLAQLKSGDLATLIYTSGTTGEPKGVMLTHGNMVSNVLGATSLIESLDLPERLMLSFLPLAHAFERTCGFYAASIRFGFTMAFAESVAKLPENLREVRPTVLIAVPRIFEKIYARLQTAAAQGVKHWIFRWAVDVGKRTLPYRLQGQPLPLALQAQHWLADRLIYSKVRELLGGRLRYAISGGAPLARELGEVFGAIGVTVLEGYGLTESSPILAANRPGAIRFGSVGKPWPAVDIRIQPEPGREGEGEILARGPNIMQGYHHKPEATAEMLDADGWLHTGDIGKFDEDGFLHVTDRKKDLIKTAGGKYVAPQMIENRFKLHPLVDQAVVIGDQRKYCVALLSPRLEVLAQTLKRPIGTDFHGLNQDPEVQGLYKQVLDEVNRDLGSWEQIKRVYLLPSELSQEHGELTPTLKVKRRIIDREYKDIIDGLYTSREG
jgi:long-chain acyl-CoA synthetase